MRKVTSKFFTILVCVIPCSGAFSARVVARNSRAAAQQIENPTSEYTYNYMYPYLNNQMKTDLNPGGNMAQNTSPINVITQTYDIPNKPQRRVVARSGAAGNVSRSANVASQPNRPTNNANTNSYTERNNTQPAQRRVIARATSSSNRVTQTADTNTNTTTANTNVSTARCYADYIQCMNGFCERPETAYNRCYCSAKLSQIDSEYQPKINDLVMQIAKLQGPNQWTDAEMSDYWNETIGKYTGDDMFASLDNALNINWADLESRVRGQNAFTTGHEYCVQHLTNCAYAASNLRDAYRSEIARDCANYETSLERIKNAAESIIGENK